MCLSPLSSAPSLDRFPFFASDVTLRTEAKDVPGHKFVLDARGGMWTGVVDGGKEFVSISG